jgi:hypothetical protein
MRGQIIRGSDAARRRAGTRPPGAKEEVPAPV